MYSMSRVTPVYSRTYRQEKTTVEAMNNQRYDWEEMRKRAAQDGSLPDIPIMYDKSRKVLLRKVAETAERGDLATLQAFHIGTHNSAVKIIGKFRDVCVIALTARQRGVGGGMKLLVTTNSFMAGAVFDNETKVMVSCDHWLGPLKGKTEDEFREHCRKQGWAVSAAE